MAIDEEARRAIHRALEAAHGAEVAGDMMQFLSLGERLEHLASKKDLQILEHKVLREVAEVKTEVHKTTRNLILALTPIFAALNGVVFAALKLT